MAPTNDLENKACLGQAEIREQPRATTILDLPPEVRIMIFMHANQSSLEVHKDTATILSAFSNSADPRLQSLHDEAKGVHNNHFFSVNKENEETFKKLKRVEKNRIKHLEVVAPLRFRAQPIVMHNNIESLTLDYSKETIHDDQEIDNFQPGRKSTAYHIWPKDPEEIAKYIIRGSKQVKRIVLKMKEDAITLPVCSAEYRVWRFSDALGVDVKEKGVLEGGVTYWIWEAKRDNAFSWSLVDFNVCPVIQAVL